MISQVYVLRYDRQLPCQRSFPTRRSGDAIGANPPRETMESCLYPTIMLWYGENHPGEAIDVKPPSETVEVLHWVRLWSRAWTLSLCFVMVKSILVRILMPSHQVRLRSLACTLFLCFLLVKSILVRLLTPSHHVRQLKSCIEWGYEGKLEPYPYALLWWKASWWGYWRQATKWDSWSLASSETMKSCLNLILILYCGEKYPGEAIDAKPPRWEGWSLTSSETMKPSLTPIIMLCCGENHRGEAIGAKPSIVSSSS